MPGFRHFRPAALLLAAAGLASLTVGSGAGASPARRSSSEVTDIFLVPAHGGRVVRVTDNDAYGDEVNAYDPSWSPDGRRILFSEIACDGCRPEIHVVRATAHRGKKWLGRAIGYGLFPRWAPNGKLVAFVGPAGGIYVMSSDGSHRRLVAKGGFSEDGPSWSPDSRQLVFSQQQTATRWRMYAVRIDGSHLRPLTSGSVPAVDPAWSPNGRKIAFAQQRGRWHIYTLSLAGGRRTRVSSIRTSDSFPSWSPDGRRLAVVRQLRSSTAVFTIGADGRGVRRISPGSLVGLQPAWSPGGRQIAFAGTLR